LFPERSRDAFDRYIGLVHLPDPLFLFVAKALPSTATPPADRRTCSTIRRGVALTA
jgi:hypothetical protein